MAEWMQDIVGNHGSSGVTRADPTAFAHDYHRGVWRDCLTAIRTGKEPRVNGEEGLRVHRFIDAVLAAG